MDTIFFLKSAMFGVALAMDAFSVSLANGLNESGMKKGKHLGIAGIFAFFQAFMPMIGWILVHTVAQHFALFDRLVPWIALALLGFIGGKMLWEGIRNFHCPEEEPVCTKMGFVALVVQGVATSIDALSVGFDIKDYDFFGALVCAAIIAAVTFAICFVGVAIGKRFGTCLSGKASVLGGVILILIGLEIFISGLLG